MILSDIRFNNHTHAALIAEAAGVAFNPLVDNAISRITPKGNLWGGVIFQNYTGEDGSVAMNVAGFAPRWISRSLLWLAFDYPFKQLGVRKIFIQVRADNKLSLRFVRHIGFSDEAVLRDALPDGDIFLLAMYRDDCRFIGASAKLLRG